MRRFAYRLAKELGTWDVDGMLDSMMWDQLQGWVAYAEAEPFGEERADLRAGIVASVIANVNRDPKKGRAYGPSDFMPKFGEGAHRNATGQRKPLTDPAQWALAKQSARAVYGGRN